MKCLQPLGNRGVEIKVMVKERASICAGLLNETSIMKLTINAETSKCTEKEKQK